MKSAPRPGYGLFQLLVVIALIALLIGMMLPAVFKVHLAAARMQSSNNLKQLGIAVHNYNDAYTKLPAGVDEKQFSTLFHLLPFIEQDNLFKSADMTVDSDNKANAKVRSTIVKTFLSPLDPLHETAPAGGTNYFAMAGSKMELKDNDGAFYRDSKNTIPASFTDGTSNTIVFVELLRGDNGKKAESVQRQHIRIKAADLATLKEGAGVKDFANGKNIAANRGAAWIDGRFLQATTNTTMRMLDKRPDVDCGGEGGLAGVRTVADGTNVALGDGSVRFVSSHISLVTWKAASTTNGGEVLGADW